MNHLLNTQFSVEETKELVNDFKIGVLSLENSLFNKNEIDKIAGEIEDYLMKHHTKQNNKLTI